MAILSTLARYRKGTGLIDNLTYTYKNSNISNLLDKVEDASGTTGFINGVNTTNEYSFDGNGNLTADLNKGYTSILYNYLNLPKRVGTATAGQYISYIYDAAGTKLAKVSTAGAYTYYAGNFVYGGSSLNYIIHSEGHLEPSGAYKYYLKDHLGSVRLVVNTTGTGGTIEQQTDYYPFGMTIAEYNGSVIDYRYNGKELQDDLINGKKLDWYDYGFRFYDPAIARFTSIDPLTEKNHNQSGFVYAANNPVKYIDFMGLDTLMVDGKGRFSDTKLPDPGNENDVIVRVQNKERENGEIKYRKDGELRNRHDTKEVEKNSVAVRSNKDEKGNIKSSIISTKDIDTGLEVFKWLADNTSVEYSYIRAEGMPAPTITTNHTWDQESLGATEAVRIANQGQNVIHIHNHPSGVEASDADKAFYNKLGKYGIVLGIYSLDQYKSYQKK